MTVLEVDFSKARAHTAVWKYGDIPNGEGSFAYIECICGWKSEDMYIAAVNPEDMFKIHLREVGEPPPEMTMPFPEEEPGPWSEWGKD